ncbi:MAG: hypothetical protein K6T75_02625 [Acetobacteraceae bacterium]|nr:hypothetical protein [Acetobacteraceae bacterium]
MKRLGVPLLCLVLVLAVSGVALASLYFVSAQSEIVVNYHSGTYTVTGHTWTQVNTTADELLAENWLYKNGQLQTSAYDERYNASYASCSCSKVDSGAAMWKVIGHHGAMIYRTGEAIEKWTSDETGTTLSLPGGNDDAVLKAAVAEALSDSTGGWTTHTLGEMSVLVEPGSRLAAPSSFSRVLSRQVLRRHHRPEDFFPVILLAPAGDRAAVALVRPHGQSSVFWLTVQDGSWVVTDMGHVAVN